MRMRQTLLASMACFATIGVTYAQTLAPPAGVQQFQQRHLQQKQNADELAKGVAKQQEEIETQRLLKLFTDASAQTTSTEMAQRLRYAEKAADDSVRGRHITPEFREKLLNVATDIKMEIAKLQVAEETAAASTAAKQRAEADLSAKTAQLAQVAKEAKRKADEKAELAALLNADTTAYPACNGPETGEEIFAITLACITKDGFIVHEVIPGKEPEYEAVAKKPSRNAAACGDRNCCALSWLIHPLIFRRRSFATVSTNFD